MKYNSSRFQHSLFQLLVRLQQTRQKEGGYSLVVTVAMLLILSTLLISAAVVSKVDTASTNASARSSNGFYAAEAGLNIRAAEIQSQFQGFQRPAGTTPTDTDNDGEIWDDCASGASVGTDDFICRSLPFQGQEVFTYVQEIGQDANVDGIPDDIDGDGVADPISIVVPSGERFAGLSAQEYRYDLWSVAQRDDLPSAILGMTFKSRVIPLFQFAVFYENDADFSIPPDMTINGRVHTNGDLYLNSAFDPLRLTINGDVTTAGNLYRGNKDSRPGQQCDGNVTIRRQDGVLQDLLCQGNAITTYDDTTTTPSNISTWGTAIDTGIDVLEVPSPDAYNPTPGSSYWDAADLRIVLEVDANGNPTDRDGNGYVLEVRNQDGSTDETLSERLLNSCPVREEVLQPDSDGSPTQYQQGKTRLQLLDNSNLGTSDANRIVTIGAHDTNTDAARVNIDIDSNVISSRPATDVRLRKRLNQEINFDPANPLNLPALPGTITVRKAVVSTSNTFYNYREKHGVTGGDEGRFIRMVDVDVQALLDCSHDQQLMGATQLDDRTEGGLVWFITVDNISTPGTTADKEIDKTLDLTGSASQVGSTFGVRLYNGASLNTSAAVTGAPTIEGLTVISDEAVYVRGDYNLHTDPDPAVDTWRPAAIMADSINVLSNSSLLDDSDRRIFDTTGGNGHPNNIQYPRGDNRGTIAWDAGPRDSSETTINAAFLSGTEITGGANGPATQLNNIQSGGVNNFPRFHENWSGVPLNYRGSLVSLNEPRRINSDFCGSRNETTCNIYSPPIRNWDFDQRFNDAGDLPPLTPRTVYLRQELFQRDFDRNSSRSVQLFASAPILPSIQPNFSL